MAAADGLNNEYFLYEDYKQAVRAKIESMPKKGRGQIELIAKTLNVHQSFVSQVLNTDRNFSEEQALLVCRHFGFNDNQAEYFIALVQMARTSNLGLKAILNRHVQRLKTQSADDSRLDRNLTSLNEDDKQVFYSHWSFMAVWLLTAIPGFDTTEKIAVHLHLAHARAHEIIEFLLHVGLCVQEKGKLSIKVLRTLVTKGSPMLSRHHTNWRLRAIEFIQGNPADSLFYTHPMAISEADAKVVKAILIKTISNIEPLVEPSQAEKTFCLNIDWFES